MSSLEEQAEQTENNVNFEFHLWEKHPEQDERYKPLIAYALKGAQSVWNHNVNKPTTCNFVFWDRYVHNHPEGTLMAGYNYENDTFNVALNSPALEEFEKNGIPKHAAMFIRAAHEATHRVQFKHRGETPAKQHKMSLTQYLDDPQEREAWDESLHALASAYGRLPGIWAQIGVPDDISAVGCLTDTPHQRAEAPEPVACRDDREARTEWLAIAAPAPAPGRLGDKNPSAFTGASAATAAQSDTKTTRAPDTPE